MPSATGEGETSFMLKSIFVVGMLVAGSANTVTKSAQNGCDWLNSNGEKTCFKYPWSQTLVMFVGESLVIVFFFVMKCVKANRANNNNRNQNMHLAVNAVDDEVEQLLPQKRRESEAARDWKAPLWLVLPTVCDLAGTTLGGIGLLYVSGSVWQMVRGSIVIFTTLLSVLILKQKKHPYHWVGLLIVVAGISVVGSASLLTSSQSGDAKQTALGLMFVVAGQFVSAMQMIVEELFIKKRGFEPAQVVGFEGCWGVLLMLALVLPVLAHIPGSDHGAYENALEAADLAGRNSLLMMFICLYCMSIAFYNFFGLSVAKALTSVHRTLIDAMRTILVWSVQLLLYYAVGNNWGEPWSKYSPVQLTGFVILLCGTLTYNHVITFRCLEPRPEF